MYDHLKEKTALYIEDEIEVLQNISELLSHFFDTFHTASNGETGYQLLLEHKIDVLLVDIELPGMSGIELIRKIREKDGDIPIVIISAYTKTDYLLESIELRLDQYIVKPLTSSKIHDMLKKFDEHYAEESLKELSPGVWLNQKISAVIFDNTTHLLTKREMCFLNMLAVNKFVSYDEMNVLWENEVPSQNAIRSYIKHLRKKLPDDLLKNRNGLGYALETVV